MSTEVKPGDRVRLFAHYGYNEVEAIVVADDYVVNGWIDDGNAGDFRMFGEFNVVLDDPDFVEGCLYIPYAEEGKTWERVE